MNPDVIVGVVAVLAVLLILGVVLRLFHRSRAGRITLEWVIDHRSGDDGEE